MFDTLEEVNENIRNFPGGALEAGDKGFRRLELTGSGLVTLEAAAGWVGMDSTSITRFNFGNDLTDAYDEYLWSATEGLLFWNDFSGAVDGAKGAWFWVPGDKNLDGAASGRAVLGELTVVEHEDESFDEDSLEDSEDDPLAGPVGAGGVGIEEGDCLLSLAWANGFLWKTLWDSPDNKDLRAARGHPGLLLVGDRVIAEGELKEVDCELVESPARDTPAHYFRRLGSPCLVRLRFTLFGQPRKDERYVAEVAGKEVDQGALDADGLLEVKVPATAEEIKVFLGESREEFSFSLGTLGPVNSLTGMQTRLANLNYYHGEIDGNDEEIVKHAVKDARRFMQRNFADLDDWDDLWPVLVKAHGC